MAQDLFVKMRGQGGGGGGGISGGGLFWEGGGRGGLGFGGKGGGGGGGGGVIHEGALSIEGGVSQPFQIFNISVAKCLCKYH